MLNFPDNTKASVFSLDEIMAELYDEDRKASYDTADENIERLKEKKNFYPHVCNCPQRVCFCPFAGVQKLRSGSIQ